MKGACGAPDYPSMILSSCSAAARSAVASSWTFANVMAPLEAATASSAEPRGGALGDIPAFQAMCCVLVPR